MFAHVRRSGRCRQTSPMTSTATACWPATAPPPSSCWPIRPKRPNLHPNLSLTSVVCLSGTDRPDGPEAGAGQCLGFPLLGHHGHQAAFLGFNGLTNRPTGLSPMTTSPTTRTGQGKSLLKIMLNGSKTMCASAPAPRSHFRQPVATPSLFTGAAAPLVRRLNAH